MLRGRKACQIADELVEGDDETFMTRVCNENVAVFPMNVLRAQQRTCFQSWLLQLPPIRSPGPLAANGTAKPRRVSCILFCLKEGQFVPQFFFLSILRNPQGGDRFVVGMCFWLEVPLWSMCCSVMQWRIWSKYSASFSLISSMTSTSGAQTGHSQRNLFRMSWSFWIWWRPWRSCAFSFYFTLSTGSVRVIFAVRLQDTDLLPSAESYRTDLIGQVVRENERVVTAVLEGVRSGNPAKIEGATQQPAKIRIVVCFFRASHPFWQACP